MYMKAHVCHIIKIKLNIYQDKIASYHNCLSKASSLYLVISSLSVFLTKLWSQVWGQKLSIYIIRLSRYYYIQGYYN
jgi:hypothetical protein